MLIKQSWRRGNHAQGGMFLREVRSVTAEEAVPRRASLQYQTRSTSPSIFLASSKPASDGTESGSGNTAL